MNTKKYRLSGMNEHFVRVSLQKFLDCMVKNEVENVELWAGLPHFYALDVDKEKCLQVRKLLRERDLNLICYCPEQCIYPYNMAAREESIKTATRKYYEKSIQLAAELGAPMIQIVGGWGYRDEPVWEAQKRSAEAVAYVSEYARENGLNVVLEALEPQEANIINTSVDIKKIIDDIGMANLGAVVDTCPMAAAGETIDDCFSILGDKLWHFHFIDRDHLVWGDGDLPLEDYLASLDKNGYTGYLTIEVLNERYVLDPETAFSRAVKQIRSI